MAPMDYLDGNNAVPQLLLLKRSTVELFHPRCVSSSCLQEDDQEFRWRTYTQEPDDSRPVPMLDTLPLVAMVPKEVLS